MAEQILSAPLRAQDGTQVKNVPLEAAIFSIDPNVAVMHQVVTAQLAAARSGTQSTKTRSEVRGGGAKPFRQKGTGRARQGSSRAPHHVGGGVALAPKPRSYRQKTPKKMVRLALNSALSDRAADDKVIIIKDWNFPTPCTKDAIAALSALEVSGKVLIVLEPSQHDVYLSFRNLQDIKVIPVGELNAYDVLCSDWVIFTENTLPNNVPATGKDNE